MTKTPVPATQLGGHADLTGLKPVVSDRVTIQVEVLKVFTSGLLVTLLAVLAKEPGAQWVDLAERRRSWRARQPWLGVKFADGRTGALAAGEPQPGTPTNTLTVKPLRPYPSMVGRMTWLPSFVTPAPPPGPISLVIAWPAYELSEHHIRIPGQLLDDAARRVIPLGEPA